VRTPFGTFWGAEGAGAHWPAGDGALLAIVPATLALSGLIVLLIRRPRAVDDAAVVNA
jgi:uncharacterized membrane protein